MAYENILAETDGGVGLIRLNRPKALNALNNDLIAELGRALDAFEADDAIGCIVITGSEKAFAAGADIKQMADGRFADFYARDPFANLERVPRTRKPLIAAVAGYALGGGCELAMMCDFIIAADTAKFGQPEITLGVMPAWGGSQRLTRSVGKAKAMDLCLTGRMMDAAEAERAGLVARVVTADKLMEETLAAAKKIAAMGRLAAVANKEAVNAAFETPMNEGLRLERRLFYSLFATEDQKEGMAAFIEKRPPNFQNR
ncbi:enoyl-CoA hydratase [Terricaulis sp.]|uniref:enoyl-CoA hydratase n=1 Tax=Terricaulis sp. TaxID=2768686 RepID=UPI0037842125